MANILINGLKANNGGGKNILDNYIKQLYECDISHTFFVLTPSFDYYQSYQKENVHIIEIDRLYKKNIFFVALYFYKFPILLKKLNIDLIFNFGDVIIPSKIPQIFFFDWPYAVYPAKHVWQRMLFKDYCIRKSKVFLMRRYIKLIKLTIVQTDNIAVRLKSQYNIHDLVTIPTPLGLEFNKMYINREFFLPSNKKKLLFPASYSPHKNFEILISLGILIKNQNLPYIIILTIEEDVARKFLREIKTKDLDCIINVGKLEGTQMPSLYQQCDAILFPTLLETYGLPYIEAMAYGKSIITSDLDFAKAVCNDFAYYFDPFDANSILLAIQYAFDDETERIRRINFGKAKVDSLPDWKNVFFEFQKYINLTIDKL
jgi:glycosyltransferase involved in cell wall biosynthesis